MIFDPTSLQTVSLLAFVLVFLGGMVTSIGPCNIATILLIVGYVGGSHDLPRACSFALSLVFAVGLALTFMLLGVAAALIGGLIGAATRWWYYLVAAICFVIGLNMFGVLNIQLPL
jgi:cytochrome c-type biogenesis protein